jgi:hypothetical protein
MIKNQFYFSLIFFLFALLFFWGLNVFEFRTTSQFISINILMVLVTAFLIFQLSLRERRKIFVNPIVLCSVFSLLLPYCLTNILYFFPEALIEDSIGQYLLDEHVVTMVKLALVATCALWMGYSLSVPNAFWAKLARSKDFLAIMRRSDNFNFNVVFFLYIISILSRLLSMKLGIYTYTHDIDNLMQSASYSQYLYLINDLGSLCLIVISLYWFKHKIRLNKIFILFSCILAIELLFGLLTGFKGQFVKPLIVVGICFYYCRGNVPKIAIVSSIGLLIIGYLLIDVVREKAVDVQAARPSAINLSAPDTVDKINNIWLRILERINLTRTSTKGIRYLADFDGKLPEGAPDFRGDIFYAPIYAVVPRFIMKSKPTQIGLWYAMEVQGSKSGLTAAATGHLTCLYYAGGYEAVFIGFLLFGLFLKAMYYLFFLRGGGRDLIYICLIPNFMFIDSNISSVIIYLIRKSVLLTLLQALIYRKSSGQDIEDMQLDTTECK